MRLEGLRVSTRPHEVVKIGGSLVADPVRLTRTLRAFVEDTGIARVIVPGGGPFADAVRNVQGALGFDDRLAHRLALDAMTSMAQVFHAIEPRIALASTIDAAITGCAERRTVVWSPADIRDGHPDIQEGWDVTSDSLAIWLATECRADSCVLMKSVDAPEDLALEAASRSGLVDGAVSGFAARFTGRIVLRGPTRDVTALRADQRRVAAT